MQVWWSDRVTPHWNRPDCTNLFYEGTQVMDEYTASIWGYYNAELFR